MPELVYRVRFEIEKPDTTGMGDVGAGATSSAAQEVNQFYQQTINNSKQYQAVIKQELNITNNIRIAQNELNRSRVENHKVLRGLINDVKNSTLALREQTTNINNSKSATADQVHELNQNRSALLELTKTQELQNALMDQSHPLFREVASAITSAGASANSAANVLGKFGSTLRDSTDDSANASERLRGLIAETESLTAQVRMYNSIAIARGKVDQESVIKWQAATKQLQQVKQEMIELAQANKSLDVAQINKMNSALRGAGQAATSADRYLSGMAGQMAGVNRLGNNVNQVMLSFGDALQDSAQFSYGFANGMRAVGNNLTFAAEQFGYAYQRAGSMRDLMGQFISTIKGPVGIIVVINAAVTVITMLADAFKKSGDRAGESADSTSRLVEQIKELSDSNIELLRTEQLLKDSRSDSVVSLDSQIKALRQSVKSQESYIKAIEESNAETVFGMSRADALEMARANLAATNEDVAKTERELIAQRMREVATLGLSFDATEKEIETRKELNKRTQDAINFIADYTTQTDMNSEAMSEMFNKGNNLLAFFRSSGDLTRDQVEIGKELERVTLDIASAISVQATALFGRMLIEKQLISGLTDLGQTDFQQFFENEEKKRKEAKRTAQLRAVYEKFYITEASRVYSQYNSIREAVLGANDEDEEESNKKRLDSMKALFAASAQVSNAIMQLGRARTADNEKQARKQFETNKKLAYASAVINGAAAVVDVYRAQKGSAIAKGIAAGLIGAAVGVQIAKIAQQKFEYSGGTSDKGGATGGGFGFQMNEIEGPQTFRTPGFVPTASDTNEKMVPTVQILADRKQLYYMVKMGEEEYREIQS